MRYLKHLRWSQLVYVMVRSADVRGCNDTRVMPTLHSAMVAAEINYSLDINKWEPFLHRYDPHGPLTITESGKTKQCRYVGWQQELDDGTLMQIFEEPIRDEAGY